MSPKYLPFHGGVDFIVSKELDNVTMLFIVILDYCWKNIILGLELESPSFGKVLI